jgi:hypothetical protein
VCHGPSPAGGMGGFGRRHNVVVRTVEQEEAAKEEKVKTERERVYYSLSLSLSRARARALSQCTET